MLLRNHPLISYSGAPSWPPAWTWTGGLDNKHMEGEIGILRDVLPSNIEAADKCFLYIDHGEASYIGCLLIEDNAFCRQVVELLLANRNRPIVEIGNLDVSHSL